MALTHRVERIAEQIREEASQILLTEIADPGVGLVTVTRVKVTPDLSLARIYWTTMGDATQRKQTAKALSRAAAYVRHLLSTRMTLRRSPEVQFLFDQSVAAQDRVEQILRDLHEQDAAREAEARAGEPADEPAQDTAAEPVPDAAATEPESQDEKPPRV